MRSHLQADRRNAVTLHPHWSHARAWQTNLALAFLGVLLFLLSRHLPFEYEDHYVIGFSGTSGWSVWCYALACLLVFTRPSNRLTLPIILTVAIACRLTTLFDEAYLSSDVYRYIWDGVVQHAGINPYRYVPADAHLTFLRGVSDDDIYPYINRADYARTIYPPFAQFLFFLITLISPTLTCMKTLMVLCEGVTLWSILYLLRVLGRPREQAILYAWCPILIWEIAASGHLDSAAMALIGISLVFRYRRQPVLTGLFLGLAVITKMYPLVLFPALYMRSPPGKPFEWRMPAACVGVILLGYAAYASAGRLVFGFLGGYVKEEGMASGTRYFVLELAQQLPGLHHLPTAAFFLFAAATFAVLSLWAWRTASPLTEPMSAVTPPGSSQCQRSGPTALFASLLAPHQPLAFLPPAFALACALMLLFSPHYAWYIIWLTPFLAVTPNLPVFAYLMGFFYLYTTALADPGPKMFLANQLLYALVAVATILEISRRRWSLYPHRLALDQPVDARLHSRSS